MKISTRGRYSLEALLSLALLGTNDSASTRAIAEKTGVSERYLEQLFILLRGAGIIKGIRGAKGGCYLGRSAKDITVGDILRAAEGPMELVECVAATDCPRLENCASRHTWSELYSAVTRFVDSVTLADLTEAYWKMGVEEYNI
ncbi:MAG: Rrf2 family transcriptional regulator [Spirochaetaceae bacterium]|jgi:Rrf2 family protein|nr:Rrf2 family transcriptional regulator [Spirochaetaceae bacterium]